MSIVKAKVILTDSDGTERSVELNRRRNNSNMPQWDGRVVHPSGENWPISYTGADFMTGATAALDRKEYAYESSRSRGHRVSQMLADRNVPIYDDGSFARANITTTNGQQVAFGKAAAALARARSEGRG